MWWTSVTQPGATYGMLYGKPSGDPFSRRLHGVATHITKSCTQYLTWYMAKPSGDPFSRRLHGVATHIAKGCTQYLTCYMAKPSGDPFSRRLHGVATHIAKSCTQYLTSYMAKPSGDPFSRRLHGIATHLAKGCIDTVMLESDGDPLFKETPRFQHTCDMGCQPSYLSYQHINIYV